jgi:integrase
MARGKLPIFERFAADGRLLGYQVKIRRVGYPTVSQQFDKLAAAEKFAVATLREMDEGKFEDRREVDRTTLEEAIDRYLDEVASKRKRPDDAAQKARIWKASPLAKKAISKVRAADLAQHRDERLAAGKSGNTVRLDLGFLSHVFTVAIKEWNWPIDNPVARLTMPKVAPGRERRLEALDGEGMTEEHWLLAECDRSPSPWLANIVRLALATGMRRGEILGLKWAQIDLDRKTAHLVAGATKTNKSRTVPLSSAAIAVLRGLPRSYDGKVFPIGWSGFGNTFARACKRAGIDGLTFHDLRHEATSRLFEKGLAIQEVAAITGHQSLQMLKRYTHLRAEDLAKKLG